jgi:hypothetical protein
MNNYVVFDVVASDYKVPSACPSKARYAWDRFLAECGYNYCKSSNNPENQRETWRVYTAVMLRAEAKFSWIKLSTESGGGKGLLYCAFVINDQYLHETCLILTDALR